MGELSDLCDVVFEELSRQGAGTSRQPGLSRQRIVDVLAANGLPAHPDVIEFYEWSQEAWLDVFLCPISLDLAVHIRQQWMDIADLMPLKSLFPLLTGNGDVHIAIDMHSGALYYVDVECDQCDRLAPDALSAMKALEAGLLSGALAYDPDERRDVVVAHPRWSEIYNQYGIISSRWYA